MSAIDRNELDGYEPLSAELRATAPIAPDRLRDRVLEGAPAPRRRRSRRRKLALVVVPVAVALAVVAAFVHGFVSAGSRDAALPANARVPDTVVNGIVHGSNSGSEPKFAPSSGSATAQSESRELAPLKQSLVTIPRNRLVH